MLKHRRSGQAYIQVRDAEGRRRQITLGKAGSPEAQRRYHQAVARWHAERNGGAAAVLPEPESTVTVAGAAARYLLRNETYYRHADGTPTGEADTIERELAPLIELFGDEPLDSLTAKKLALVRRRMIDGDPSKPAEERRGWCRTHANAAVRRIRGFARWCVAEGYASPTLPMTLAALPPLKRGRSDARESPGKRPAPEADVEAALPFMPETVQAMVRLQLLTACRPTEVREMRAGDVKEGDDVWLWTPRTHKNAWRGHERTIVLGPKAIEILRDRVKNRAPDAPVFSPAEAERLHWARRRQARETPRWPSHVAYQQRRHEKRERRVLNDVYDQRSYSQAIARACRQAKVPVWSPGRLRHTAATRTRERYGVEAAAALCGHRLVETTQIYAAANLALAKRIAREVG